jgi:hypothetical protein
MWIIIGPYASGAQELVKDLLSPPSAAVATLVMMVATAREALHRRLLPL